MIVKNIGIPFLLFMQTKLMSWNTRGLMSATVCLANLLRSSNCDLVVLSEHKLHMYHQSILSIWIVYNNYYAFSKCEPQASNELQGKAGVATFKKVLYV